MFDTNRWYRILVPGVGSGFYAFPKLTGFRPIFPLQFWDSHSLEFPPLSIYVNIIIGTWFHEFLYPLDYLSKYKKDKKKKIIIIIKKNLVLYNR